MQDWRSAEERSVQQHSRRSVAIPWISPPQSAIVVQLGKPKLLVWHWCALWIYCVIQDVHTHLPSGRDNARRQVEAHR
jgi:hypothetical protein